MSKQTHHSTLLTRIEIYSEIEKYLLQAQALNLTLQTSDDVDEEMQPAYWLMDDLLNNITAGVNHMWDEFNGKNCNTEHG